MKKSNYAKGYELLTKHKYNPAEYTPEQIAHFGKTGLTPRVSFEKQQEKQSQERLKIFFK